MSTATETERRYFDYPAAARYSGMSEATLRRLVEAGRLKAYRPTGARKIVFDVRELDSLIQASAASGEQGDGSVSV